MEFSLVSNDMRDNAVRTYHICSRCISFFATGEARFNGMYGCNMTPVTDDNRDLYASWAHHLDSGEDVQAMKCNKCFLTSADCFALPSDFDEFLPTIQGHLDIIADPATTPDARLVAQAKLAQYCRPLNKKLTSTYSPHAAKLFLHSGAIGAGDEPATDLRADGRKRDKATQHAKLEASKRKLEAEVAAQLNTPTKKHKSTLVNKEKRELEGKAETLLLEYRALEAERDGASGSAKGALTKRINAKRKERKDLLTQAAKL